MIHKLYVTGLVLVAMFAVNAFGASTAHGAKLVCTASSCFFQWQKTAGEDHSFTFNAGTVKCKAVSAEGSSPTGEMETMSVVPTYKECTMSGIETTVKTNGCEYKYAATTTVEKDMKHTGTVSVVCPAGKQIEIVVGAACTILIGAQEKLGTVTYTTNTGGPVEDIGKANALAKMVYSQSGLLCAKGTFENGAYQGSETGTAFDTAVNPINTTIVG